MTVMCCELKSALGPWEEEREEEDVAQEQLQSSPELSLAPSCIFPWV